MKNFFGKIKGAISSVFKGKRGSSDDYEDRYHDDDEEGDYFTDEDYEDYEEDDEDFVPQEFTLSKEQKQVIDGEVPGLPPTPDVDYVDDESEEYEDELLERTKPGFNEFKIPTQEGKLKKFFRNKKENITN